MGLQSKRIRSRFITTELSEEGQLMGYQLTYPVNQAFVDFYGFNQIMSKAMISKTGKRYFLHYYVLNSMNFRTVKAKAYQLQLLASTLRLKQEQWKNNLLSAKLKIYELEYAQ